jgi:hypothetical protein
MCIRIQIGPTVDDEEVRTFRADHKSLLTGDDVLVSIPYGASGGAEKIRTAPWFCLGLDGNQLAGKQRFEILLLL